MVFYHRNRKVTNTTQECKLKLKQILRIMLYRRLGSLLDFLFVTIGPHITQAFLKLSYINYDYLPAFTF